MNTRPLLGASLLATLVLAGCQDQVTQPTLGAVARGEFRSNLEDAALDAFALGAPVGLPEGAEAFDLAPSTAFAGAINPGDYVCNANTDFSQWINGVLSTTLAVERPRFIQALNLAAADLPTYDALYFQTTATEQSFGVRGEHTKIIRKSERDLKNFWAIYNSDIQVVAMHGRLLADTAATARLYRQLYGRSAASAAFLADTLRRTVVNSQTMQGGDYPYFTFNAFAFSTPSHAIPDKIVMGDGILAAYDGMGYSDVAPRVVFAHEFAHHVQFEKAIRLTTPGTTAAERTRYNELGADAMSAYYLTHARGAAMNRKRVEEFLRIYYGIGDCSFGSSGHHGTPNQRMKAAQFGFRVADEAQKQGHIMSPEEFQARFVAELPAILAPDAP